MSNSCQGYLEVRANVKITFSPFWQVQMSVDYYYSLVLVIIPPDSLLVLE